MMTSNRCVDVALAGCLTVVVVAGCTALAAMRRFDIPLPIVTGHK